MGLLSFIFAIAVWRELGDQTEQSLTLALNAMLLGFVRIAELEAYLDAAAESGSPD
jgi:hypothetical protein